MKNRIIRTFSFFLVLVMLFSVFSGGSQAIVYSRGNDNVFTSRWSDKKTVRKLMLGKYYIFSEDDFEQELLWDFENRLYVLCELLGYEPEESAIDARATDLYEECCVQAENLGISPEDYARQHYLATSIPMSFLKGELNHEYFYYAALADLRIEWAVGYLGELWNLEESDDMKKVVMDYSVEHSRIVRREKNVNILMKKLDIVFFAFTNAQMLIPAYVPAEDGYAAMYSEQYRLSWMWLDPFLGELIAGTSSADAIYRLRGSDDWDWIIVRRNGTYGLYHYLDWYNIDDAFKNEYKAIYGVEPKVR